MLVQNSVARLWPEVFLICHDNLVAAWADCHTDAFNLFARVSRFRDKQQDGEKVQRRQNHSDPLVPAPAEVRYNETADQRAQRVASCDRVHIDAHLAASFMQEVQVVDSCCAQRFCGRSCKCRDNVAPQKTLERICHGAPYVACA